MMMTTTTIWMTTTVAGATGIMSATSQEPEIDFVTFVMSLAASALLHMGEHGGLPELRDTPHRSARWPNKRSTSSGCCAKTRGNLTADEDRRGDCAVRSASEIPSSFQTELAGDDRVAIRRGVEDLRAHLFVWSVFVRRWPSLVSAADEPVVLIGVSVTTDAKMGASVASRDHLARNGELLLPTPKFGPGEQQCTSQECSIRGQSGGQVCAEDRRAAYRNGGDGFVPDRSSV